MKIVLAFDSFKGCISAKDISVIASRKIKKILPTSEVKSFYLADGGEGTLETLIMAKKGRLVAKKFTNLGHKKITSKVGFIGKKCIIEAAQTVGLNYSDRKHVPKKTTKGIGEQIKLALDKEVEQIYIALGGTGTNDVGLGILSELGYTFLDKYEKRLNPNLANIKKIASISNLHVDERIFKTRFYILTDVKNPLFGKNGATYVYGPQKGLLVNELSHIDNGIKRFSRIASKHFNFDISNVEGAGAGGGLGYAFMQFLNAEKISGIEYVLDALNIEQKIKSADIVLTGEGRSDFQTMQGKVISGVSKLAKKYNKPVLLVSGSISEEAYNLHDYGVDYITSIQDYPTTLKEVMNPKITKKLIAHRIEEIFRLISLMKNLP